MFSPLDVMVLLLCLTHGGHTVVSQWHVNGYDYEWHKSSSSGTYGLLRVFDGAAAAVALLL